MLDIQAIRRALADQISQNITATPNVYAYLPDAPMLPCIGITADDPYANYNVTMPDFGSAGGDADLRLLVRICAVGRAEDSQVFLDAMLSSGTHQTSSVVDAIESDQTLGGIVEQCQAGSSRMVPDGEQNATAFEAVIPVTIMLRQN
jgi:hypothetical protein